MKSSNRYNLRKRVRKPEENSARKRIKIKSDTESDEDFSPDDYSRESEENSDEENSDEENSDEENSDEENSDEENSDEENSDKENSDEENSDKENSDEEDSDEEETEEEDSDEESEIHPSVFRTLGYGYRPGGKALDDQEERNEFFEPDTEDLSNEITNHVMKKFAKLGLSKKELKKAVESSMKQARADVFDEYCDSKPKDKRWKVGLDKETVKRLEPLLKKLRLDIQKEKPTISKILEVRIPRSDKMKALERFNVLENTEQHSMERIAIENEIKDIFRIEKGIGKDLERYEKEETKIKELVGDYNSFLKRQILDLDAIDEVKAKIYEMYLDMNSQTPGSSEYSNIKNKILWAVSIPHRKMIHPKDTLNEIYTRLDKKVYGMKNVKERVIEIFNNRRSNPSTRSMLALKGPSGVGKTFLAKALAESFDPPMPFDHISLGGIEDPSIFRGSDSSWVGSTPSIILHILRKMKYNNGIIFLDEIDKLGNPLDKCRGSQVQYALLHIVDYTNNKEFQDVFLNEFTHDFSNIWWIFGMNDDSWLDSILRSRLDIVTIEKYKNNEKVTIVREFMIPEIIKDIGLPDESVSITDHACNCLIMLLSEKMRDGDLRPLKQELHRIISRVHMLQKNFLAEENEKIELSYSLPNFQGLPHTLTSNEIERLWTSPKINVDYLRMYG
uniref:ATP-dependent Lon protease n=1 Tax=Marseillevirus LCMAC101 TaxID=2506602 RepID=A0A481YRG4_9VIRU|nr:MAG: ATP-dependent Lon protease [Marseillevirus LCMAC101]